MVISSIKIKTLNTENRLVAVASITLDGMIAVHGIKILKNQEGFFLAMPSRTVKPGKFEDVAHPVNASVRAAIENIIVRAYEFCVEENLYAIQLDIIENDCLKSLLDQCFENFLVSFKKEEEPAFGTKTKGKDVDSHTNNDILKKSDEDNAFWDWLSN